MYAGYKRLPFNDFKGDIMIYYALLAVCLGLIIFSGYKHYKQANVKQLNRPRHRHQRASH